MWKIKQKYDDVTNKEAFFTFKTFQKIEFENGFQRNVESNFRCFKDVVH